MGGKSKGKQQFFFKSWLFLEKTILEALEQGTWMQRKVGRYLKEMDAKKGWKIGSVARGCPGLIVNSSIA